MSWYTRIVKILCTYKIFLSGKEIMIKCQTLGLLRKFYVGRFKPLLSQCADYRDWIFLVL